MMKYQVYYGIIGHLEQRTLRKEDILAESDNYLLYFECESVSLYIKNKKIPSISVGDHYGNPKTGLISKNEDYLISGGCGINLAFIENIYNDGYRYDCAYEGFLNTPENIWWVKRVFQVNADSNEFFRFHCANNDYDLAEYSFNAITKEIKLIEVIEKFTGDNAL